MPVPFPPDDQVLLRPPDAAESRVIAGGVAAAIQPSGGLTNLQRVLVEAMTESMTGFVVPVARVPRLNAHEFATAMACRNEMFRARMVQFMLLCSLVLVPLPDEVIARVEDYANELGIDEPMMRVASRYAHGSLGLALVDFQRSGYMETWDSTTSTELHTSKPLADAWEECVLDRELARHWASLRDLPDGTLGREVAKFYDARGFVFPGLPGSAPPRLAQHDWVHVLADYGSTVECEIEVFGFIARANDDPRAFSLLAMVVSLFETGYMPKAAGLFEYSRGHLSHEGMAARLADAMRRGALVGAHAGGPNLMTRDWFADAARPLADVRAELGIVPKSERALGSGSVTPWEPGGISPYQFECGRKAAAAAGRAYESYGARPVG
jgi:hypothetical protein